MIFPHFGTVTFLIAPTKHALIGEATPIKSRQFKIFIRESLRRNVRQLYLHFKTFSGYPLSFFFDKLSIGCTRQEHNQGTKDTPDTEHKGHFSESFLTYHSLQTEKKKKKKHFLSLYPLIACLALTSGSAVIRRWPSETSFHLCPSIFSSVLK